MPIIEILGSCLFKCCIDHGLPLECIHEETKSSSVVASNDTHKAMTIIHSNNCLKFTNVLQDCKAKCVKGKLENVVFYLNIDHIYILM